MVNESNRRREDWKIPVLLPSGGMTRIRFVESRPDRGRLSARARAPQQNLAATY